MKRIVVLLAMLCLPWMAASRVEAQGLDIDIVGGTASALPIAIVPMQYQGGTAAPDTDIASVISADLNRSGQFRTLGDRDMVERPTRGAEINFATWRLLKQDYVAVGRILDSPDGGYRVEYELYDVARQERLEGVALGGRPSGMRDVAHQIADRIYEKILGVRGAFWTRIAYITASGTGQNINYALVVADSDGYNPQTVVRSREPLLSPSWSPDGKRLAYVSFERGNSSIYIQDITTGAREVLASYRGINGAPSFSPDGNRLALTLSRTGNPEIYVMDLGSRSLTQLTNHWSIDTEPTWSPDGRAVYFTSDRGGKPQIYQVPAGGGDASRVTFEGSYNADATVSFDGAKIAVAQGSGNVYRIALMDRSGGGQGRWQTLSPGNLDESPSFAPNASMILYAARDQGRGVLYAVSADGRVRQRLVLADGDVREPAWSPFRQR
ncbi:Tol-Pal system beta propeller repeat protein TolB [Coralloluteibacterium stylophorae]|uniref:Tol-Pal system protein TolB n=1 Tax=Coralloluteibacterium stylophorae TaxID=1776034 RepID=A0A8J7VV61_9GAMM|nr:Tol-Pal system beta propeller repeat protein TolB [Coralloluteibacterium stylophorae]MBS7456772.1 Tol-Pal system beta propeller repeat protein TolB [Coralloluteibacterium stylophorae]